MPEKLPIQTVIFALNGGILALLLSERLKLPGIILYLLFGIALGPFFLNLVQPQSLGPLLTATLELGVALIMFEGALHLNIGQYRDASKAIRNLVSVGLIISVVAIMLMTRWLFAWPWEICLLFGVLMSITGPTVIAPILRKVPLKQPIGSILHWESILLEPIVVVGAVLIVEFLLHTEFTLADSFLRLLQIMVVGGSVGAFSGFMLKYSMKRFPMKREGLRNLVVVGLALLIFEISNIITPDSGLVAIVVAGFILGNSNLPALYEIKQFKEVITRVMISFLFILLSANLDLNQLISFSTPVIFLLLVMIFVIRPLVVFISMSGSGTSIAAKVFISLTAPRGIVAASMASLIGVVFAKQGSDQASQFEILAYQVIFITVFTQALWSKPLAALLKVLEGEKHGYVIVGAHPLGVGIAQWMKKLGLDVMLVDRDSYGVYLARKKNLVAFKGDALSEYFMEELPLQGIGNLLALTSNDEVNTLACQLGKRYFGPDHTFQTSKQIREEETTFLKTAGGNAIFPMLPALLHVLEGFSKGEYEFQTIQGKPGDDLIPLFVQLTNGSVAPVTEKTSFDENSKILALKKKEPV